MLNRFRQQAAMRSTQIMAVQTQRTYLKELGLDSDAVALRETTDQKAGDL